MSFPENTDRDVLLWNMDARVWATEFKKRIKELPRHMDDDDLISWFANAIMTGYDNGYAKGLKAGFDRQQEAFHD